MAVSSFDEHDPAPRIVPAGAGALTLPEGASMSVGTALIVTGPPALSRRPSARACPTPPSAGHRRASIRAAGRPQLLVVTRCSQSIRR